MPQKPPETIVLIDDSSLDNKLHKRVIDRTGLARNVLCFPMAEDALDFFRQPGAIPADLILLDINMPRMSGFEMLDAALDEFGNSFDPSVVVMLTTSLNPDDKARAETYEVIKDYLQKPLTEEKFKSVLHVVAQSD